MSRRMHASILSALLLAALPGAAIAQDQAADAEPMWRAAIKNGAADAAAMADGYVLVGGKANPASAKVWTSPDGRVWTKGADDPIFEGARLTRVEGFGEGAFALGQAGRKLLGFSSPDGISWQRTTIDRADKKMTLFPIALTDGPNGLLGAAHLIGQDLAGQHLYRSADGQAWTEIAPPLEASEGMIVSLTADADEYLAIARSTSGEGTELYWRSPDGEAWQPFDGPADGSIFDLAIGDDGRYVAVGRLAEGDSARSAIWSADELGEWELAYSSPSAKETEERLEVVEATVEGFVAGGITSGCPQQPDRSCPTAAILESGDGREWTALGVPDGVPGPLHDTVVNQIASYGDSTVMLAWHEGRPTETWTKPLATE